MSESRIVFEIKRDICRKRQFVILLPFHLHDHLEPPQFFSKILTQTVRVPNLLGDAKCRREIELSE